MDKWKEVLSCQEIQVVEDLCSPEMQAFGYERTTSPDILNSLRSVKLEESNEIDPWFKKYMSCYELDNENEIQKELTRQQYLKGDLSFDLNDKSLEERICIVTGYLEKLKNISKKVEVKV